MTTEDRNPRSFDIDRRNTLEILETINAEDQSVAHAIQTVLPELASAIDAVCRRLEKGGRLFYVGAGTSGRLGVLDAVEIPPTYGVAPELVQAILAGGPQACHSSVEAAEDDSDQGAADLRERKILPADAVVGIAASGRTPYTCGAIQYARGIGALTVGISCNVDTPLSRAAEFGIEVNTGPEVVTGSTRMKAGTSQKLILNMISTSAMIRLGHIYSNLMVNVDPKNSKLVERGIRIVGEVAEVPYEEARAALESAGDVKKAILLLKLGMNPEEASKSLNKNPNLRRLLESAREG